MFQPGDVVHFWSDDAGKRKYHLCISIGGYYLYINSPKSKTYPGDFIFSCIEVPFLPATSDGNSIISCTLPMHFTDVELSQCNATKKGAVSSDLLRRLLKFVEHSPVVTEEQKTEILDGLGDWV